MKLRLITVNISTPSNINPHTSSSQFFPCFCFTMGISDKHSSKQSSVSKDILLRKIYLILFPPSCCSRSNLWDWLHDGMHCVYLFCPSVQGSVVLSVTHCFVISVMVTVDMSAGLVEYGYEIFPLFVQGLCCVLL